MLTRPYFLLMTSTHIKFRELGLIARIPLCRRQRGALCLQGAPRIRCERDDHRSDDPRHPWSRLQSRYPCTVPARRLATRRARKRVMRLAGLFAVGFAVSLAAGAQSAEPLRLTKTIPLPEVSGRLDHLAIDLRSEE